ncbi:3-O-alpha-D-mannopyranosyl-alpha-D-mannopyranose xylosylphosphotransferase [Cryptococcus amylolentus CBS 6039]|uniref:3-O-alpha-D-mannopyranosyl-alpha-D-mannopyranose xylosylphosphotransferase n=1 Tax=Cryptococcus amylolentus CBS 6039 TaxID=1295533 RepID=A0A1E3HV97_9TREE|nr:3-O-alpha-D-mannopyranosyl-alpha-D-mannopyranose xylosylphosphotransferase [Cryptococcus amylolentus CBS 6039]ODN79461.1 3-O-alpha-D-mannopyranosyl-alpha-D-mannopyranose xylosylphosphotransferase [Cryptococcus amylolentus CBS 6039]
MPDVSLCLSPMPLALPSRRTLAVLLAWAAAVALIHTFLFPLPLPALSLSRPTAQQHFLSTAFPQPPHREGDDQVDSVDPRWRPFHPLPAPEPPFPRLRPTRFLPPKCLEQWFIDGETLCGPADFGDEEKLDATWLWVNGSDHRWRDSMVAWRTKEDIYSPEHHFREQNELVHSMRSVLDALPGRMRTFHLILADYPFNYPEDLDLVPESVLPQLETAAASRIKGRTHARDIPAGPSHDGNLTERVSTADISPALQEYLKDQWRVVQTPTWLDFSRRDPSSPSHPFHPYSVTKEGKSAQHHAEANYPTLRYAAHSEIFHLPSGDRDGRHLGEADWREQEWRKKALPTFNSMAIEGRIGWLPGLADAVIALNDDFFLLRPHAVSDFHSPLYGSVIRFDHGYNQQVKPDIDRNNINNAGEIGGLYHANALLSQRFPHRLRPYFAHVPKTITRGLHHEASLMFKEAMADSGERRFREMKLGDGDVQMQWLLTALRVERWREALLWTWVVTNMGTRGSTKAHWDDNTRSEIKDLFGFSDGDDDVVKIEVHRGERWTLENGRMQRAFEQAGWEAPKATEFLWSSMDGPMPHLLKGGKDPETNNKCMLDLNRCFGSFWSRGEHVASDDMFKRLTFQYPECGDCLTMALVTASGPLGLSAFFPPKDTTFTAPKLAPNAEYPTFLPPPHLPLTPTWHEADFSLESVMTSTALPEEEVDLRQYCMKLLSRYLYLDAKSVSHFHMLKNAEHAGRVFKQIQDTPSVSILGMNDDIEADYDETKRLMNEWFEMRWPRKAVWERDWDAVKDRYVD